MPTPEPIQGILLPTYEDGAAIPDHLRDIVAEVLSRAIPRWPTTAQRDAAYPAPTNGQLCWIDAESTVYVRAGGEWQRMWRAPVSSSLTGMTLRRDGSGTVTARYSAQIGSMTSGQSLGTVPVGMRPGADTALALSANANDVAQAFVLITAAGAANLYFFPPAGVTPSTSRWLRGSTAWETT